MSCIDYPALNEEVRTAAGTVAESTEDQIVSPDAAALGSSRDLLAEVLRRGALDLLIQAVEAEVAQWVYTTGRACSMNRGIDRCTATGVRPEDGRGPRGLLGQSIFPSYRQEAVFFCATEVICQGCR